MELKNKLQGTPLTLTKEMEEKIMGAIMEGLLEIAGILLIGILAFIFVNSWITGFLVANEWDASSASFISLAGTILLVIGFVKGIYLVLNFGGSGK